jgi:hypothetical protein
MLRRPSEPCSSKTSSVVSKVHRRLNRFERVIPNTSVSNRSINYSLIICLTHIENVNEFSGVGSTPRDLLYVGTEKSGQLS